jgi:ribonuclease G
MTKELFVATTPHETKVGIVEDDQLAEIYLERENEYTLAGSIYKGRVTRVLPGMQSAFVDIGLERDAFLYVSDFMDLEDQEEVDAIPTNRPVADTGRQAPRESQPAEPEQRAEPTNGNGTPEEAPAASGDNQEGRSWHGRRRRRGRRDRMPESRPSRPSQEMARDNARSSERRDRDDFGPPPGYEPIVLPGESISKYQRKASSPARVSSITEQTTEEMPSVSQNFPDDEPLFAVPAAEMSVAESPAATHDEPAVTFEEEEEQEPAESQAEVGSDEWDREQKRQHERNVAAVFGEQAAPESEAKHDRLDTAQAAPLGAVVEEEIEEEEADLAHYVEDLEEDAAFEEMEEEVRHADGSPAETVATPAASSDPAMEPFASEMRELHGAPASDEAAAEVEEDEAEDAAIEEAQAEAEALLAAETEGGEARAEVRAPAATASYAQRPERRGGERSFRGRRGRRFRRTEPQNVPQISDVLKEGQEILVQIAKEPIGKKGARITSHIALPGRFLVYMPTVNHTGVSRKIASDEERQRLKRIIQSERENGHGGFIVRTAAQGAAEEELRADIRFLKGLWSEIKTRAEMSKSPALIYHDLNVVERVLRDQVTSDFGTIWVDNEQEYERILRFANRFQPALVKKVKLYTKETPLFEQFGLTDEINKALKSKVWLKSGGYIVINQTEALVAIDINTGKYVGKTARLEDTIVKTNVDAIKEIVRQIRLRDLGGIIIIDFIDMDERRNRQKVMQALEDALRSDRAPSKVLQFNDFGLVAITRKRVKQSLERTIGSPCPYCESTGFVKSVQTVCNEIYIEMRKLAKHLEHQDVILRVNPEVGKALKSNSGKVLSELEELTKKTVIVKSDPALHQEQFDIN